MFVRPLRRSIECKPVPALYCRKCKRSSECRDTMISAINAMFKAVGCNVVVPTTQDDYYRFVFEMQEHMGVPTVQSAAHSAGDPPPAPAVRVHAAARSLEMDSKVPPLAPAASHSSSQAILDSSQQHFALYCAKLSVVQLFSDFHDPKHKPGCAKNGSKECRFNAPHKSAPVTEVKLGASAMQACCTVL
jgi:hypothetical protein